MPAGLGASPYWSPGQFSGPGGYDYGTTAWGQRIEEQQPGTAFYRYGRSLGIPDDGSGFSRWFSQQFPDVQRGYGAYTVSNPMGANIQEYLRTLGGYADWERRFKNQDPRLRGESYGRSGAGPMRHITW